MEKAPVSCRESMPKVLQTKRHALSQELCRQMADLSKRWQQAGKEGCLHGLHLTSPVYQASREEDDLWCRHG